MKPLGNAAQLALGAVVFVAEIALWLGAGRVAFLALRGKPQAMAILAWVLVSALLIVLWGLYMAPRAPMRLSVRPRVAVVVILSILVGVLLKLLGSSAFGLLLAIPGTIILVLGQIFLEHEGRAA